LFNRNLVLYTGGWSVFGVGLGVWSVLFNLYAVRLGIPSGFVGVLAGAGSLAWALCSLSAGAFVRRVGLRFGLTAASLLQAVATVAILSVEALPREIWQAWLLFWSVASGVFFSPIAVSGAPLIMQVTAPHLRRQAFTANAVMFGVTGFAGSLVGGQLPGLFAPLLNATLQQSAPYHAGLLLVPIARVLISIIWSRLKVAPLMAISSVSGQDLQPTRLLIFIVIMVVMQASAEGALRAFFNLYLDRQLMTPVSVIGLISAVAQVVSVAAVLLIPAVLRWAGNTRTLGAVSLGIGLCMAAIAGVPVLGVAAIAYIVAISLIGIGTQVRQMFGQELVTLQWRTTASSVNQVGVGLGNANTALLGGLVLGAVGFTGIFGIGAALALAAATSLAVFSAVRRRGSPTSG
jgi:MFS family permease